MSVSEKTFSVPSRPTGSPPRRQLASQPEQDRQGRANHDARAPGALGRKRQRVEEPAVHDGGRDTREEEKERDHAPDRTSVAERARARSDQRNQPADAVPPFQTPLHRARLGYLHLDVRTLLAHERARAWRAIERRVAVTPAAVAEGTTAAPALVRETAAPAPAVDRHPQNEEGERDERPRRKQATPLARRGAVAGKPAALGLGV